MPSQKIYTYDSSDTFAQKFMPGISATRMLRPAADWFFIVKVEEMYRLVQRQVPASRAIHHTCIYLTSGTATMKIGSQQYTIRKGQLLFVPAGQVFAFGPGDVNTGFLMGFHPDMLYTSGQKSNSHQYDFLKVWGVPKVELPDQVYPFVLSACKRMLMEYRTHALVRPAILQSYLTALLSEAAACYASRQQQASGTAYSISNKFRELVTAHITTEQRVTDYARRLHITPNHLNKVVKSATGKSPTRWIDEAIVAEAKIMLYQSEQSIGEIAATVGIADAAYFSRLFKKYEGITPNTYRRRIEKS
ncbi:MAG: AraC family transcriptional regulator [Bacteroidetes bacterium]|nr:AraC family transcriptional regulator [Bacteroidota bacterium]